MKKSILIIITIIASLLLFGGCGKDDSPPQSGQSGQSDEQTFQNLIDGLTNDDGSKTTFNVTISGGYEKEYGYSVSTLNGFVTATVYDGETKEYTDVSLSDAAFDYENNILDESGQGKFLGNLKDIVFFAPNKLFNLNDTTVRSVSVQKNNDGTTTYTPSLYESQVKSALPCFKNLFLTISDVVNLQFRTDELGSKTEIAVQMQAKDLNATEQITVLLTVVHTKTIKVIE